MAVTSLDPAARSRITDDQSVVLPNIPAPATPPDATPEDLDPARDSGLVDDAQASRRRRRSPRVSRWDRPAPPKDWRWFVGHAGRVLIILGLMVFGFVAYQLWGTGIETARAQRGLENDFEELLAEVDPVVPADQAISVTTDPPDAIEDDSPPGSAEGDETADDAVSNSGATPKKNSDAAAAGAVPVADQNIPAVEDGDALARIEIPRIGVDFIVVAGVSWSDLKKGPGHYPDTPLPGQLGNAAIAGHRTTYGQPFHNVDQLEPGDEIIVTSASGRFVYRVTGQQIVSPNDYEVVSTTDPTVASLTLTSCNPKWSASQRIIISSELDPEVSGAVGEPILNYGRDQAEPGVELPTEPTESDPQQIPQPLGAASTQEVADDFANGWFSDPDAPLPVALWGLLLLAIGIGGYLLSRRFRRTWVGLVVGFFPFVVVLFFFYQNVNRLLPPNL